MPTMFDQYRTLADFGYSPSMDRWRTGGTQDDVGQPSMAGSPPAPAYNPIAQQPMPERGSPSPLGARDLADLGLKLHKAGAFDGAGGPTYAITPQTHTPTIGAMTPQAVGQTVGSSAAGAGVGTSATTGATTGAATTGAGAAGATTGAATTGAATTGGATVAGAEAGALAGGAALAGPMALALLAAPVVMDQVGNPNSEVNKARGSVGAAPFGGVTKNTDTKTSFMSGATGESPDPMSVMRGDYGPEQAISMEGGKGASNEILKKILGGTYPGGGGGGMSSSNAGFMRSFGGAFGL